MKLVPKLVTRQSNSLPMFGFGPNYGNKLRFFEERFRFAGSIFPISTAGFI
jgi:hypothetical protein